MDCERQGYHSFGLAQRNNLKPKTLIGIPPKTTEKRERRTEVGRKRGFLASSETAASETVFLSNFNNPFQKENQGLHPSMGTRICILRTHVSARWIW